MKIKIRPILWFLLAMPIAGQAATISHVQLAAPAPLQAVAWYTEYMDCEPIAGRDEAVHCAGMDIEFTARSIMGTSQGTGVDHISFSHTDVAARMEALAQVGVGGMGVRLQRFDDGSIWRDVDGFFTVGYIFDPWGTRIELVEDPRRTGFHHIHLSASDPAATLAWYAEHFGGERRDLTPELEGLLYDGTWLLASLHDTVEPAPTTGRALDHIAFTDDDIDTLSRTLVANGVERDGILSAPDNGNNNARRLFLMGPDNVRLALVDQHWSGVALAGGTGNDLTMTNEAYTAPRTPWGEPDLQGIWTGDAAHGIPLERPEDVPVSETLSAAEAAARRERGTLRSIWGYEREWRDTTLGYAKTAPIAQVAMVIDPPDGRLPALTPEAQARLEAARQSFGNSPPPAGPEDLNSWVRCITQGLPNHMMPTVYNNGLQIVQGPNTVAITKEMIHETRIINIDEPLPEDGIEQWLGSSRGWWEDDTLVVETRDFNGRASFQGSSENMVLTERFTRIGPNLLQYQFTVDDPTVWTQPWTAMFPFVLDNDQYELVEYACHEGNYAMANILSSAREAERNE